MDNKAESPQPENPSRRTWFKKIGAAAAVLAGGLGLVSLEKIPNDEQKLALEKLNDPKVSKGEYVVSEDPDIIQMGGLNVRKEPRIPIKGEGSNQFGLLQPGEKITGIDWLGRSTQFSSASSQQKSNEWVAFKTGDGRVGFVNDKYLQHMPTTMAQSK